MSSYLLRMQHTSLQFNDSPAQQHHDIVKIFREGDGFPIKTGTEAGDGKVPNANREILEEIASEFDHVINFGADNWVAVDRTIIKPRSLKSYDVLLAPNSMLKVKGLNRVMAAMEFDHVSDGIGHVAVGAVHYPTKGALPGSRHHEVNQLCAEKAGEWLSEVAQGSALGFLNGDFNMNDRTLDFALGRNFSSMADKLQRWQNTGHGPIDGFCSYDRDGRVTAERFKVLNDREFHLFTDHYTCRGSWKIKSLKEM